MNEKELKTQLTFIPKLEGGLSREDISGFDNVMVGGMGGSALAARILFFLDPTFPIWLHDDYGFPAKHEGKTLYVAISYSGNTAETLSFAKETLEKKYSLVIITSGGALLDLARENTVPHVLIPSGFEPRNSVLIILRTLLYVIGREDLFPEPPRNSIDIQKTLERGQDIGKQFTEKIPLIYASRNNYVLAYLWKIMFNETGKVPAFANYFPELAHNETQGIIPATAGSVAEKLQVLLLLDQEDSSEIAHEMKVFQDLALSQGVSVIPFNLPLGKIDKLLLVEMAASAAATAIADSRGVNADSVPFITLFKKSL